VYSIIVVCVFGYLSAVAPSFVVLILFRFGVGIGVGGMAVPFDLLAELLPTSHRGRFLIYLQGFWTIGAAYVVTMAWLLMDRGGWRLVTVMTAVPVTVSLILAVIYLPESPRWLLIKNRPQDAADLVTHIAQVNGTPLTEPLQLKLLSSVSEETVSFAEFLKPSAQQKLFIPMWIVWFCFGFGYYGVVLLMVRVFEDRSGDDDEEQTCDFDYGNILINSSTEVLAVVMLIFMIEPVGRIKTMFFFFFTAGVSVLFIAMPMSPITFTFVAAIVRIAAMGANLSTWVATAEIFPTRLRATGHALATAMERLGSLLSPFLVDSKSMGLGLVSGVLCAIHMTGMVCTLALPETQGKDLDAPLSSQSQGDEFQRSNGDSFDNSRDSKSLLSVNDQIELSNANVTVRKD
jgi:putative MFS transporter